MSPHPDSAAIAPTAMTSSAAATNSLKEEQDDRIVVGGTAFHRVTMEEAVSRIVRMAAKTGHPCHVCTGNLDHLALMEHHPHGADLRHAYETADLVLADGMPVVWMSRFGRPASQHLPERVAGSDLVWELARASARTGLRLFLLGGAPGAAQAAAECLQAKYPGAIISGVYCPPHETFDTPEEQERILEEIRAASPDVLLVGFGAPKQERWIVANKAALGVAVSIGVGGSFEMACGRVKRAPEWARRSGFEWLCRLCQEPKRLASRYLGRDLPFLCALLMRHQLSLPTFGGGPGTSATA